MLRYSSIIRDVVIVVIFIVLALIPPDDKQKVIDMITCFEQTGNKGVINVSSNKHNTSSNNLLPSKEDGS